MSLIGELTNFVDETDANPEDVNANFDKIKSVVNGDIDEENLNFTNALKNAILDALKDIDGSGSGLDADTVDGKEDGSLDAGTYKENDIDSDGDGTVDNADKLDGRTLFVQSTEPTGEDGDLWIKV